MITFILNDPPYGTERSYNGLRLALSLKKNGDDVQVFLMADSIFCAIDGQKVPNGYYNIGTMIKALLNRDCKIHTCGTCCDARGISEEMLLEKVKKSDLDTLTKWTSGSAQTLVF
jgi:uncharacterized protein involved in oxidation of intracellular sulfur